MDWEISEGEMRGAEFFLEFVQIKETVKFSVPVCLCGA